MQPWRPLAGAHGRCTIHGDRPRSTRSVAQATGTSVKLAQLAELVQEAARSGSQLMRWGAGVLDLHIK